MRIDIEEYDLNTNWYYRWYVIHDGGQNLDYIEGDGFGNPPDGIFVGLEPGLDEDPSSEDWFRWDDVKLDEQYYISSFDNFSAFDEEFLGFDLEVIGRVGYNWDGVGNNTINSSTPSGMFLKARPHHSGLLVGEYVFTHNQTVASDAWYVAHALGHPPITRVFDSTGTELLPLSITTTNNITVIKFTNPIIGTARLI